MTAHLEIACFNAESIKIAQQSGADRIEFCAGYSLGGITPDFDILSEIKPEITIPVFVMIRPRGGNFVYDDVEFAQMKSDIKKFKAIADGFVFGILTSDSKIDTARNSELVQAANRPCTFHRAFDEVSDPDLALEEIIACGFQNILTSGGKGNAVDNIENLTELIRKASGRITIMPGGGIRENNIEDIAHSTAIWFHTAALSNGEIANAGEISRIRERLQNY